MADTVFLSVKNLSKVFNARSKQPFIAINDISFSLKEGEVLGFLGPNGAGKTTTIQMLLGLMTPTSGGITYFGKSLAHHRSEILQHVTFASAYTKLAGRLTILENLQVFGQIYQMPEPERSRKIKEYLQFFGLWNIRSRLAGVLSAGQTTRLMLAKAFLPDPKVVLLDEPTASLDPDVSIEIRKFILAQRKERNISVLFTSHNMAEVEELCDRVLILKRGAIIADNTPYEIARSISHSRVHLMFEEVVAQEVIKILENEGYYYTYEAPFIAVEVEEEKIATFLRLLSKHNLDYTQIYIEKPTLEDYFIQVAHDTEGDRL